MSELRERDSMICRRCQKEERASEGYPCVQCGTFLCLICSFRGFIRCASCEAQREAQREDQRGEQRDPPPVAAP